MTEKEVLMLKEKIIKICDLFIEGGVLAIVFFMPLIFDVTSSSYNFVDLYRVVVFRVIITLMLLAYTAKIFIHGKIFYRGSNKIFFFILAMLLSFFISSLFSLQPNLSFWGSFTRQQGFYNFFNYLLFFILLILNFKDFRQIKRLLIAVISSASIAALYGLSQYFKLDPFSWGDSALISGRIFSTFGQPNFFGHWLIMVLPLSLYYLIFLAKSNLARFFIGLTLFLQFACLTLTYSRAAWLGFLGSMFFLVLFWLFYMRQVKIALGLLGLFLIGLAVVVDLSLTNQFSQSGPVKLNLVNRLKSMADFKSASKIRYYTLKSAAVELKQMSYPRLLVGYGPETLAGVLMKYYQPDWGVYEDINSYPDRAHNWPLDQLLAIGVLGLSVNLIFYLYFIYQVAKFVLVKKTLAAEDWLVIFLGCSLVAYVINNLFSFSLITISVYLYFILAMGWFIIIYQAKEKSANLGLTAISKLLIWLTLLAVLAVLIYTNNINQVRAEIYYMKALKAFKASNCPSVIDNITKTIELSPSSGYYQKGYLYLLLNCFPLVDKKTQIALRDDLLARFNLANGEEPYSTLINQARAYSLFGFYLDKAYYLEADKIFNDLILTYPYLTTAYEDLGKQKIMQEDYRGAIEIFKRALEILPPLDQPNLNLNHRQKIEAIALKFYEGLGQAYFKIKNYGLALDYYKKALKLDPYKVSYYKNIADIYYVQGELDQAIVLNQRGLMLNPADYHWPLSLSLLYRDKKDLVKAKAYLDQAIKLAPENKVLKKYYEELNK